MKQFKLYLRLKKFLTIENIILLLIFLLFFFLRFYQVPERFFFGIDEEYSSLLALSIIKDFHIIWIGLSAANTGFYVGPGVIYIHSFLLWLSKLDPIILAYLASILGSIFSVLFYFTVKHLFNKKVAYLATIVYGLSSFVIMYDRRFWNSAFIPGIVLLFYLSLIKSAKNPLWYILTAILLGISFHINASLFVFIPIIVTIIIWRFIHKPISTSFNKFQLISTSLFSFISFLLIYSPLIVFDFVHNFDNLKTPIRLLNQIGKGTGGNSFSLFQHFDVMKQSFSHFWGANDLFSYVALGGSLAILVWFFLKQKGMKEFILAVILIWYVLLFALFPGRILDYYYIGFFPFFALVVGIFFQRLNRWIVLVFVILSAITSITTMIQSSTNTGILAKKILIKKTIKAIGNNTFYLDTNQDYLYFGGWRYLFEAFGKKPASSQADSMFSWIYPKEISSEKPKLKVIISESNQLIPDGKIHLQKISSGIYNSYILKNE